MDGEARLEQLDRTLEHLERLCGRLEHAERHFKQLTDDCTGVLQGLVAVDRRHASAVAGLNERLGDWCNLEGKLLEESARRIAQFERGVSHEWIVLRQLNEEPISELREQADALRRTCLEAARLARLNLETAEQKHASHSADLERRMIEWQRRWVDAASAPALAAAAPAVEPWPLEGVAQLHQELRTGAPHSEATIDGTLVATRSAPTRQTACEDVTTRRPAEGPTARHGRRRRLAATGALALVLTAVVVLVVAWSNRPAILVPPATQPAALAPDAAAAAQDERRREDRLAEAQRVVERAGIMVEVLAAPDLLRYALAGTGPAPAAYAQVLWSRSRGLAVTASRLPAPPEGKSYRMWVMSAGEAAAVGLLTPDASGRASLVLPGPLTLPRLVAIRVTLEDPAGADRPSGAVCLVGGPTS